MHGANMKITYIYLMYSVAQQYLRVFLEPKNV